MSNTTNQKEKTIIEVMNLIRNYAEIVCYDNDYFKDDIISDCIVETVKLVNGDKNNKLSPKDIFTGWIKDSFDKTLKSYNERRKIEIPFSEINKDDARDIRMQKTVNAIAHYFNPFFDDADAIYILLKNV